LKDSILIPFIEETSINIKVIDLMRHSYGNYVIQKALKLSNGVIKKNYISLIMRNIQKLNDKKLIYKWTTIVENSVRTSDQGDNKKIIKIKNVLSNSNQKKSQIKKQPFSINCVTQNSSSNFSLNELSSLYVCTRGAN